MRRSIAAWIALALLGTAQLAGQGAGRIEGSVKTPEGRPIVNARVFIIGSTFSTGTDLQGRYSLEAVPAGTVSIRAQYTGYKARELSGLRVPAGQTVTALDFVLAPDEPAQGQAGAGSAPAGIQFRFQLIKATATKSTDPAISGVDSVLKDLFRFPGYKLLSSAAMAVDYAPVPRGGSGTNAEQLLNGDGATYRLSVRIDTATAAGVRVNVYLTQMVTPVATRNAGGGTTVSADRITLLNTTVTLAYGHTVVLGNTQPGRSGTPGGVPATLILTVKPEIRTPF